MDKETRIKQKDDVPLLSEDVPVTMPELPPLLEITTPEQYKAVGDPLRERILAVLQQRPATAKQLADTFGIAPGTIGHHMRVLESAGLIMIVARRLVRGIVAKYYTRTARMFGFNQPFPGERTPMQSFLENALTELNDVTAASGVELRGGGGFWHARMAAERWCLYEARLKALLEDIEREPQDPLGEAISVCMVTFQSPTYLQHTSEFPPTSATPTDKEIEHDTDQ